MELKVNQIISELSKIDIASEAILEAANTEKNNYTVAADKESEAYDKSLADKLVQELDEYKASLDEVNNANLKVLEQTTDEKIKELNSYYDKNHSAIARKLFDSIVTDKQV